MDSKTMGVVIVAAILCFVTGIDAVAVLGDCSADATSCDAGLVCETSDNTCRVKADGTSTNCDSTPGKCPENAVCNTDTCSCSPGFIAVTAGVTAGLCVVQDAACSGTVACGDTTKYACSNSQCKVKADGTQTHCSSSDDNCVEHATCAGDGTCSCNTGYSVLSTGLCSAIVGFTCANTGVCTALDPNTECTSGVNTCACKLGYKGAAGDTCTAVIGSACENNAACSSNLANSECVIVYPCTKGKCTCSSGYGGTDCLTLGYDKACTTGTDKCDTSIGLACDSGTTKCACSTGGESYRSEIGECTNKKLIGETCTGGGTGDCYTITNSACDTTCKCSTGYYQEGQECLRPTGGETCTDTCVKVDTLALLSGGEASQQVPSCTSSKCKCGSNDEVSRKIGSTCYTVCLSTYSGTAKGAGEQCAAFNECQSKVCAQCPDDANPKCYNAPCSGSSTFTGSILMSSVILFSIFI